MTAASTARIIRAGFYAPVAETPREDLLRSYRAFLHERNGEQSPDGAFARREAWMQESLGWSARYRGEFDHAEFERQWEHFEPASSPRPELVALLAVVKMNAVEAYGVERLGRAREKTRERALRGGEASFVEVEKLIQSEEQYHTRMLLGAAQHFGVAPSGVFRPAIPLRLLIGALIHAPRAIFHPVLLAAEISGVYTSTWLLGRIGEIFGDEPGIRESIEQRLLEILVDEVGHIAFNRIAVGSAGLAAAHRIGAMLSRNTGKIVPEFTAMGWSAAQYDRFGEFDFSDLPEEVRRKAFFA